MKATGFKDLVGSLRRVLATLPDRRVGKNLSYAMEDLGLSAFAVFFTQCPSFLAHQRSMQQGKSLNNATRFFEIGKIPSDNPIRQRLDPVEPQALYPVYDPKNLDGRASILHKILARTSFVEARRITLRILRASPHDPRIQAFVNLDAAPSPFLGG